MKKENKTKNKTKQNKTKNKTKTKTNTHTPTHKRTKQKKKQKKKHNKKEKNRTKYKSKHTNKKGKRKFLSTCYPRLLPSLFWGVSLATFKALNLNDKMMVYIPVNCIKKIVQVHPQIFHELNMQATRLGRKFLKALSAEGDFIGYFYGHMEWYQPKTDWQHLIDIVAE